MNHLHDPFGKDYQFVSSIYETIFNKNAIGFLGAGASITNKSFISGELINLYEAKISKNFDTSDIIQFVDMMQVTPGLRRNDFDKFVVDRLSSLRPNNGHEILVTIPWKQLITTNFDTLVEEAAEGAIREDKTHYRLHVIRNRKQLDYVSSDNEITYIKLNGCKTDLSSYPLVFSSEDFQNQNSYYRKVVAPFRQYSNDIIYIAFGYSFSDPFADKLLNKIASPDIRQKRTLYCVDPFINEDRLSFLATKQICVIKATFEEFMRGYQTWFENTNRSYLRMLQKFTNPDSTKIKLDTNSRLYLDSNIIQLKDDYKSDHAIKKTDFYYGEEPNYQVVVDNFDVVKKSELNQLISQINECFTKDLKTSIPKILLLKGDFGTGKTTFTLRLIHEYLKTSNTTLAFEIIKPLNIKKGYISKLIKESDATQFIFYCDNIETDSIFKSFNALRVELASEQYSNISIIFISSIRQNILAKYTNSNKLEIKNCVEVDYQSKYSREELIELLENLKDVGIVNYRDLTERDAFLFDIKMKYNNDSFITLYKLIEKGEHYKFLEKAFNELSSDVKSAFKLTALIHRFGILCPVSILKNALVNYDWDEFTDKIVRADGKGILFNESINSTTDSPDLFFKTKHPVIAQALIKTMTNREKNSLYKSIFSSLPPSDYNATFIVDLIKSIRNGDADISEGQIDNYYELARKEFEMSTHFMLNYISYLEYRTSSISVLKSCISDINNLESFLERRNHMLIHRKGSVCFKIARLLYNEYKNDPEIVEYLNEAEEWFDIKKHLDEASAYSYVTYIKLILWRLKNIESGEDEMLHLHLKINTLFDEAYKTMYSNIGEVDDLFDEYKNFANVSRVQSEYLDFLLEMYASVEKRVTATILLFYYYSAKGEFKLANQYLYELETYLDDKDVVYFLFKQYGRNLHIPNNRIKYFDLVRQNLFLSETYPLRFFYFSAVAEFYNWRWKDGKAMLNELQEERFFKINPDFFLYWKNTEGEVELFDGVIVKEKRIFKVKIPSPFFKEFYLIRGNYDNFKVNQDVKIKLKFYIDGVKAEIV